MGFRQSLWLGAAVWLAGACFGQPTSGPLTEPRPLGREFKTFQPPQKPGARADAPEMTEPKGVITLREALALTLMHNPSLSAFSWETRAAEARRLQAGLAPNPELGVVVENFGNRSLEGVDATATTVQLSQLVQLGQKRAKREKLAALERDLTGWDYEAKRLDVLTDATKDFIEVLAAQERHATASQLVNLAQEVFASVTERVKAGKVSPLEETKAQVSLATSRIALDRAKRALEAARRHLAAGWGSAAALFERAEGRLEQIAPIPSAAELADAISQNPDIARWAVEMEHRRAAVKLEDAKGVPDVTVGAGVRQFNEADQTAALLAVSIPLPVFDRNQGGRAEARSKLSKAEEERKAARLRVLIALSEAYQSLSTAYAEATSLKGEVLPGAQSAFDAANEGFRLGKFGYLDVLDAQRTLFETKNSYIEALASYHKAVADVERLIAEPLGQKRESKP